MTKPHYAPLMNWEPARSFGFIFYRKKRIFVHRAAITPKALKRHENLNNRTIRFILSDIKEVERNLNGIKKKVLQLKSAILVDSDG